MKFYPIILTILFNFSNFLFSEQIEKYFKPALNKTDNSKMSNIDYIYMINLDERPEKFEQSAKQLHQYGIYPYRFSAVNGWNLPLSVIQAIGYKHGDAPPLETNALCTYFIKDAIDLESEKLNTLYKIEPIIHSERTYFCSGMKLGTIGIVLSHLSILYDALLSGYDTIWVMEDDIDVIQNPHLISLRIDQLDELVGSSNWDILFTDRDTKDKDGHYVPCYSYAWRPNHSPANPANFANRLKLGDFQKIGARYGAYSMIIRKSGMQKILEFILSKKIFLPYDFDYYLPEGIQIYTVCEDIVSTLPNAPTDNSLPNHKKLNR